MVARQIQAFEFKALVSLSRGWSQENHLLENLKTSGSMKEPGVFKRGAAEFCRLKISKIKIRRPFVYEKMLSFRQTFLW
jgi:hypothetical protein